MSFGDYKRNWKVTESDLPGCKKDKHVKIEGDENNVVVKCGGKERYQGGMYEGSSDTIKKGNEYTISIVARTPRYKIRFVEHASKKLIGGSWTAEDHTHAPEKG